MKWHTAVCCVVMILSGKNVRPDTAFTGINTLIREYIGRTTSSDNLETRIQEDLSTATPLKLSTRKDIRKFSTLRSTLQTVVTKNLYSVRHAALPEGVVVYPLPLSGSDHELMFNVTWRPPRGPRVHEYSLEVHSLTDTVDCRSNLCYEYNIPGVYFHFFTLVLRQCVAVSSATQHPMPPEFDEKWRTECPNTIFPLPTLLCAEALWSVIPPRASPVQEGCAVRPGCAYKVKLIAHPWDGHTAASIDVMLDECVAGVCSCAHGPRLPVPVVTARTIPIRGELFVNVTWTLPPPKEPLRIPPRLKKNFYFVSLGKQMVSDAHPAPWYAHTISRKVDTFGFVVVPDVEHWFLLPVTERNYKSNKSFTNIVLDVKLLARVSLVDERGCIGPAGNATAYDPAEVTRSPLTLALWAAFGGACVVAMVVILGISARVVKRILNKFRPASISAPLQPMAHRPLWFPLGTIGQKKLMEIFVLESFHDSLIKHKNVKYPPPPVQIDIEEESRGLICELKLICTQLP